jgi:hypothetical protein
MACEHARTSRVRSGIVDRLLPCARQAASQGVDVDATEGDDDEAIPPRGEPTDVSVYDELDGDGLELVVPEDDLVLRIDGGGRSTNEEDDVGPVERQGDTV